ncbi:MAG TPA: UDP-galactose-lipid carrier transferase [Solirubrobacteraceae bacterium]|jgi:polyphosphate kinase 2 (PPK2 family)|nr:UDP-galactose-lipid carrier transferase [Solirubrobacteraceae bacterium]
MASLDDVDLSLKLSKKEGRERLEQAQKRLLALRLQCGGLIGDGSLGPPLLILFEGWDAAGKGGAIRRLTARLDPRHFKVSEFAAPTDREKRHHFLWRFWPHVPGWGGMSVFDRSWYGRVLVERVEGLATKAEWKRAYQDIVEFERSLCADGTVLVKFWLEISDEEQLRRFNARANDPLKKWKLTRDDWRNREKRGAYEKAIKKMLKRTDHRLAPWTVVPANSKAYARVAVLEAVIDALERGMRAAGQDPLTAEAAL